MPPSGKHLLRDSERRSEIAVRTQLLDDVGKRDKPSEDGGERGTGDPPPEGENEQRIQENVDAVAENHGLHGCYGITLTSEEGIAEKRESHWGNTDDHPERISVAF